MKKFVYSIGHIVVKIALSKPLRSVRGIQSGYAILFGCAKRLLEKPEHRFFRKHIRNGMVICDVGAHSGYYSKIFSSLVGDRGRVLSFEPEPWCFAILKHQLRTKRNTESFQFALGSSKKTVHFYPDAQSRANSSVTKGPYSEQPVEVDMTTLDLFCTEHGITHIDALKIDTEGSETAVLRGARALLSTAPPQWICIEIFQKALKSAGSDAAELCTLLLKFGYVLHSISKSGTLRTITDIEAFLQQYEDSYTNIVAAFGNTDMD